MTNTRILIAVSLPNGGHTPWRLLGALNKAFPISFVEFNQNIPDGADAVILLEENQDICSCCVSLGIPFFTVMGHSREPQKFHNNRVDFATNPCLDRRIQGQWLVEEFQIIDHFLQPSEGDIVLASCQNLPLWLRRSRGPSQIDLVAFGPEEINEDEVLRHHLQGNRFIRLLPLIHFLRDLTKEIDYQSGPIRANIHIDDPNLHYRKYGFVDFISFAEHTRKHNYHASFAMIPLDSWFAHKGTVEVFQRNNSHLSLMMHGNNHTARELGCVKDEDNALQLLAQAIRRVASFENRYGVHISRIMIPPGEHCSEIALRAMHRLGLEGCVHSRAYMWRSGLGLTNIPPEEALACWWPSESLAGGFPFFRRLSLPRSSSKPWHRGEVLISAFLNQPILLCAGHHYDLKDGLDGLSEASNWVNSFGEVNWGSMTDMARSSYMTKKESETLIVRLFCRRASIDIPDGIGTIHFEKGPVYRDNEKILFLAGAKPLNDGCSGDVFLQQDQSSGRRCVEILVKNYNYLDPANVPPPSMKTRIWAVCRRMATEARDRVVHPIVHRI